MAMFRKKKPQVVFIAEERENYISHLSIPNVSFIIKPCLKFETALRHIKESPYYGKGTVFVTFFGFYSLMKWIINPICTSRKCSVPYKTLQKIAHKKTLCERANLLRESFEKENVTDHLLFCEIVPVFSTKGLATWQRKGCSHSPIKCYESHEINLEIDCYNEWVRVTGNNCYPQIQRFYMNFNSREMQNNFKGIVRNGIMVHKDIQQERKQMICDFSHFLTNNSALFKVKTSKRQIKVKNSENILNINRVIIIANIAYRQILEHLKLPQVVLLANEDLHFDGIPIFIKKHSYLSVGKKVLWIYVSGIYSVVEAFINPECNSSCNPPLLKVIPLQDCEFSNQRQNFIQNFISSSSDIERSVLNTLENGALFMIAPLIPGHLISSSLFSHKEQHLLHIKYKEIVCVDDNNLAIIKTIYDVLYLHWLDLSLSCLQQQRIATDSLLKYSSFRSGSHLIVNKEQNTILEKWIDFMKVFIQHILDKSKQKGGLSQDQNAPSNILRKSKGSFYQDHDAPSITELKHCYQRKFNHIVFIGEESLCQIFRTKFTKGASFIEKNPAFLLEHSEMNIFINRLKIYPENSLFILLFDKMCIAEETLQDDPGLKDIIFLMPKNHSFFQKFQSDSNWVAEVIDNAKSILCILRKNIPLNSSVIVSPINPSVGMWVDTSKPKNFHILHLIKKKKPEAVFLYGIRKHWMKIAAILKMKWRDFLVNVYKQEQLDAKIPLSYIREEKHVITVYPTPNAVIESKDNSKENWNRCLEDMYLFYLTENISSLKDGSKNSSNKALLSKSEKSYDYDTSLNDLRNAIEFSRRKKKQERPKIGSLNDSGVGESVEEFVVAIRRQCFSYENPTLELDALQDNEGDLKKEIGPLVEGSYCKLKEQTLDVIPKEATLNTNIQCEISHKYSHTLSLDLLVKTGHFSSYLSQGGLQGAASSLLSLENRKLICNLTFAKQKAYSMQTRNSLLPSPFSCILSFDMSYHLDRIFNDNSSNNFITSFINLLKKPSKAPMTKKWQNFRLSFPKDKIFPNLPPSASSCSKFLVASDSKEICIINSPTSLQTAGNSKFACSIQNTTNHKFLPLKRKLTSQEEANKTSPKKNKKEFNFTVPIKLKSCHNDIKSTKINSINKPSLPAPSVSHQKDIPEHDPSHCNNLMSQTTSAKLTKSPASVAMEKQQPKEINETKAIEEFTQTPLTDPCTKATTLNGKKIIKLSVCGMNSPLSAKFIHDLSIACKCIIKPLKVNDDYIFSFEDENAAAIFMKTFDNQRLFQSKIHIMHFEGLLAKEDLIGENEFGNCLLQLLGIHRAYLVTILQKSYLQDVDLATYKTQKCIEPRCEDPRCLNYHSVQDRRRLLTDGQSQYISTMCKYMPQSPWSLCPWGDDCRLAHNTVEQTFHPMRYKKELCPTASTLLGPCCSRISFCPFVHPGSPDALYHDLWHDAFVKGLDQSLTYLVGALRMMRRVIFKTGITALFVTPCAEFLHSAFSVVAPIAKDNCINLLALEEGKDKKITDLTSVHLLGATPNMIWSALLQNPLPTSCWTNIRVLIVDDISGLMKMPLHRSIIKTLLDAIMASSRDPLYPLNRVVTGETLENELLSASSKLLQTKLMTISGSNLEINMGDGVAKEPSSSKRRPENHFDSQLCPETKKARLDASSSILKDKSNFVISSETALPSSSKSIDDGFSKQGSLQKSLFDRESISEVLAGSRCSNPQSQNVKVSVTRTLEEDEVFQFFEARLKREHMQSLQNTLKFPTTDPEFERKFSVFISKYQSHYGITKDRHHFQDLWIRFWEQHVMERKEAEWFEKKKAFIDIWRKNKDEVLKKENKSKPLNTFSDAFSPICCSSPKTGNRLTSSSNTLCSLKKKEPTREAYQVTNYKDLFQPKPSQGEVQPPFSHPERLEKDLPSNKCSVSPISESSVSASPTLHCKRTTTNTTKREGSFEATSSSHPHSIIPGKKVVETKVEKAMLSLNMTLAKFSHLKTGFHHLMASFDDSLSVVENVKKALCIEDNVILFLIIYDSLEFFMKMATDSSVKTEYERSLNECKDILSLAPGHILF